jgi:hypothetical protein
MNIETGSIAGLGPPFTQWRIDKLQELAADLNTEAGIENFIVWYDAEHDYHRLDFEFEGEKYYVEFYKIYTLHKVGEKETRYFGSGSETWQIPQFFKGQGVRRPWPGYRNVMLLGDGV